MLNFIGLGDHQQFEDWHVEAATEDEQPIENVGDMHGYVTRATRSEGLFSFLMPQDSLVYTI